MTPNAGITTSLAPTGRLRASLNMGNPVLAHSRTATERPAGVSIDLARELGRELGVPVDFLQFDTAAKSVDALGSGQADLGFMAIDPLRAAAIHFTAGYVQIEGAYLVPADSSIASNDEVDRAEVTIVVGKGAAYALFLARALKNAAMVEVPTSEEVADAMLRAGHPAGAGVRQTLEADAMRLAGKVRVLPGRFMVINQAAAIPIDRGAASGAFVDDFIERMKHTGFVAAALERHAIAGAKVAPAGR